MRTTRVTIWNEFRHERRNPSVAKIYPNGLHQTIAEALRQDPLLQVRTATLDEPEQGLPQALLEQTDVLFWWGHGAHQEVSDELAQRVQQRVLAGMGFVALHSAHFAKPFTRLLGTSCSLQWREAGERERLWAIAPAHPLARGIEQQIVLEQEEMYGECFDIPEPDQLIFLSWFAGGEVFRSGCTWQRGRGRVFYFRPGHETYPTYHQPAIQQVLRNAAHWCGDVSEFTVPEAVHVPVAPEQADLEVQA